MYRMIKFNKIMNDRYVINLIKKYMLSDKIKNDKGGGWNYYKSINVEI